MSVTEGVADCAGEKRRRSCRQVNESSREATSSARNVVLSA
ncbi:MAG: hypothetical protein SPI30_06910 [Prevotella sp.]|nr:hypothetical protein [Prevotella sp.]